MNVAAGSPVGPLLQIHMPCDCQSAAVLYEPFALLNVQNDRSKNRVTMVSRCAVLGSEAQALSHRSVHEDGCVSISNKTVSALLKYTYVCVVD